MTQLELIEPEVVDAELWVGRVDGDAALLICAAEMQWSQYSLWKRLVTINWERGLDVGADEIPTGLGVFSQIQDENGELDVVSALQIADYYCLIMLGQRWYNTRVLELTTESFCELASEDSTTNGTYSALAAGYYSAFVDNDEVARSQLLNMCDPGEVPGALAVLFMVAHTEKEEDE